MRNFGDLNIQINRRFAGQRIRINTIIDREIIVHDIEIRDSKIRGDNGDKRCVYIDAFTGINPICKIKVKSSLLTSFRTATNWATYANYMIGV